MEFTVGKRQLNGIVSHHRDVRREIRNHTREVGERAKANVASARALSHWEKFDQTTAHMTRAYTEVGGAGKYDSSDGFVYLQGPNPMALEFGHAPSGVFGPDGRFADVQTKSPHGLYILTRAARLLSVHYVAFDSPGPNRGKKREARKKLKRDRKAASSRPSGKRNRRK